VKVSSNLTFLFTEVPFLERFRRAREAGFSVVEFMWPHGIDLRDLVLEMRACELTAVLINFDGGDIASGDRGILSDPARQGQFRDNVPVALELAGQVGCRQLNALVGLAIPELEPARQLELARENVAWAAELAREHGMDVLLEPVNQLDNGPYLLPTTAAAVEFIAELGIDNIRLQCDCFHMQRSEGNIVETLRRHLPLIGHVQVADAPARHEPGTGEINFRFVMDELAEMGYAGLVGLEYRPTTPRTEDSLAWLSEIPALEWDGPNV
jgi:hydroxypyruvate isomerase